MKRNKTKKKFNLFIILPSLSVGGSEREVLNLVNNLSRDKFKVSLVLFEKEGEFLDLVNEDITIYDFKRRNRLSFLRIIPQLARLLRKEGPDLVVQFTSNHSGVVSLAARFLTGIDLKVIISQRNLTSERFKRNEEGNVFFKRLLIQWLYPSANLIITNTEVIKQDLIEEFGLEEQQIEVVPSTINLSEISELSKKDVSHPAFKQETPVIVYVGRLMPQKNLSLLLKAFEEVSRRKEANLLIVGSGPSRLSLERMAKRLGISQNVFFTGFQSNPFKFMAKASVFAITSAYEGLPHTILEAMVCGLPIVSVKFRGVEDVIESGQTGLIVKRNTPKSIARGINSVLESKKIKNKFIKNAGEIVKKYSIKKQVKTYEQIFTSL